MILDKLGLTLMYQDKPLLIRNEKLVKNSDISFLQFTFGNANYKTSVDLSNGTVNYISHEIIDPELPHTESVDWVNELVVGIYTPPTDENQIEVEDEVNPWDAE